MINPCRVSGRAARGPRYPPPRPWVPKRPRRQSTPRDPTWSPARFRSSRRNRAASSTRTDGRTDGRLLTLTSLVIYVDQHDTRVRVPDAFRRTNRAACTPCGKRCVRRVRLKRSAKPMKLRHFGNYTSRHSPYTPIIGMMARMRSSQCVFSFPPIDGTPCTCDTRDTCALYPTPSSFTVHVHVFSRHDDARRTRIPV